MANHLGTIVDMAPPHHAHVMRGLPCGMCLGFKRPVRHAFMTLCRHKRVKEDMFNP